MSTINRLFNQTASIENRLASTSADSNVVNYDIGVEVVCFAQSSSNTAITDDYRENDIDQIIYVPPETTVSEQDRVIYESDTYAVFKIDVKTRGITGVHHHKKLLLKRDRKNG